MLRCLLSITISTYIAQSIEFYVSDTDGNDINTGLNSQNAFKTLNRAQKAIRKLIKQNGSFADNIYVNIDRGIYEESLYFNHLDSAHNNNDKQNNYIEWRSNPGIDSDSVVMSGGQQIDKSSFYECKSPFNPNINLLCANLSSLGITDIGSMITGGLIDCQHNKLQLFYNGEPQILARYPNIDYSTGLYEYTLITEALNDTTFKYINTNNNNNNIKYWSKESNGWMHGYWSNDWFDTFTSIDNIQKDNHNDNLYYISSYNNSNFGPLSNARFYVVNMLSELDTKTEYYLDENTFILYWYPPIENKRELINDIVVSIKEYVIKLSQNVSNLSFNNVSILYSRITGIYTENGKNTDFNTNVKNINVTNCIINNHGNNAIDINGQNLYIFNNTIKYVGCKGISVVGGDYYTLTSGNNMVTNNEIYNFSQWKRSYMPAIFWGGVGNIYSYNYIQFGPHNAILGGGNEVYPTNLGGCNNIFEYNYIKNTTFEVSDSGSFYTCGQFGQGWINRGNIIRHNIFENIRHLIPLYSPSGDIAPIEAIYLDDQSTGWIVENNTIINCQGGILIGGGRRNILKNNYCDNVDICVHLDNRGMTWEPLPCTPPNGSLWEGLYSVNYQNPPWSISYPEMVDIEEPCVPVFNVIENNQYCGLNTTFASFTKKDAISWNDTVDNNIYKCH